MIASIFAILLSNYIARNYFLDHYRASNERKLPIEIQNHVGNVQDQNKNQGKDKNQDKEHGQEQDHGQESKEKAENLANNIHDDNYHANKYEELKKYYTVIPNIDGAIVDPLFWIEKTEDADKILMSYDEIIEFNKRNFEHYEMLVDVQGLGDEVSESELRKLVNSASGVPKSVRYDESGKKYTKAVYDKITKNLNLESIKDQNKIRYGLTIRRTEMRTFPTKKGSLSAPNDVDFDLFVETAIYPIEPMAIYLESLDGEWYFAQMYNYIGWVPKDHIAMGNKDIIFDYVNQKDFIVVIGDQIEVAVGEEKVLYDMGVKIPIDKDATDHGYLAKIPLRDNKGVLNFVTKAIPKKDKVHLGFLPYNRKNIILQSFEFHGEPYGWGGMYNARDCSAFIMDIYRSVGIRLPRNASQQGLGSYGVFLPSNQLKPVTPIYMKGHVMLYLGEHKGEHYIIHDFAGFYSYGADSSLKYNKVMRVLVTPLSIRLSTGKTFKESLYNGREFILTN